MEHKIDFSNAAYSAEYINYRNKIINETYNKKYKTGEEIFENKNNTDDIKIISEHYLTKDKNYCEYNKIYKDNSLLHEYFTLDDSGSFCEYIKYNNGLDYIFYKEDLYGYSVFEVPSKNVFNYYPMATFKGNTETFIGTDIYYNIKNNIFAVGGCYWACPFEVFLVEIDNPMDDPFTGIKNIYEIGYDNIEFVKWENNDIILKRLKDGELIKLTEKEYMNKRIIK